LKYSVKSREFKHLWENLTAEIMLIGSFQESSKKYVVGVKYTGPLFSLKPAETHTDESSQGRFREYTRNYYSSSYMQEYYGYIIVIRDEDKNIIYEKGSNKKLSSNIEAILSHREEREFEL